MGALWPDPRFTDNGDGTVTDHLTGLIWLKNADCFGKKRWGLALDISNNLADGDCGLSDGSNPGDWRLPNVRELYSLIDVGNGNPALPSGHPFNNVVIDDLGYWSSTTPAELKEYPFIVELDSGRVRHGYKLFSSNWSIWPVRGGND